MWVKPQQVSGYLVQSRSKVSEVIKGTLESLFYISEQFIFHQKSLFFFSCHGIFPLDSYQYIYVCLRIFNFNRLCLRLYLIVSILSTCLILKYISIAIVPFINVTS